MKIIIIIILNNEILTNLFKKNRWKRKLRNKLSLLLSNILNISKNDIDIRYILLANNGCLINIINFIDINKYISNNINNNNNSLIKQKSSKLILKNMYKNNHIKINNMLIKHFITENNNNFDFKWLEKYPNNIKLSNNKYDDTYNLVNNDYDKKEIYETKDIENDEKETYETNTIELGQTKSTKYGMFN